MSGDLLPLPGVFQFRNIRKVFRHQLFKELLAVIVAQGKVTVVSAGRLNAEVVHDLLLAGVNAYLIHPHLPDNLAIDHDFLFLGRRGVRYIRTVRALYRKHMVILTGKTVLADFLCKVSALVNKSKRDLQRNPAFKLVFMR